MKYHLESEVAFCRDISSRGKFQNNSLLEKFLLQKESGEINPDPRALGFLSPESGFFWLDRISWQKALLTKDSKFPSKIKLLNFERIKSNEIKVSSIWNLKNDDLSFLTLAGFDLKAILSKIRSPISSIYIE